MSIFVKGARGSVAAAAASLCLASVSGAAEVVTTVNWTRPASTGELYISFNILQGVGQNPTSSATEVPGWDLRVRSSGGQFFIEPFVPSTPGASYWGVMQFPGSAGGTGNLSDDTQVYSTQSFNIEPGPVTFGTGPGQWRLNTTSNALNGAGFQFKNNNPGFNVRHYGYMTVEFGATVDSWRIKKIGYEDAPGAAIVVSGSYIPAPGVLPLLASAGIAGRRRRRG